MNNTMPNELLEELLKVIEKYDKEYYLPYFLKMLDYLKHHLEVGCIEKVKPM